MPTIQLKNGSVISSTLNLNKGDRVYSKEYGYGVVNELLDLYNSVSNYVIKIIFDDYQEIKNEIISEFYFTNYGLNFDDYKKFTLHKKYGNIKTLSMPKYQSLFKVIKEPTTKHQFNIIIEDYDLNIQSIGKITLEFDHKFKKINDMSLLSKKLENLEKSIIYSIRTEYDDSDNVNIRKI